MPLTGLLRVSKMALQRCFPIKQNIFHLFVAMGSTSDKGLYSENFLRQQLAPAPTMVLVTWERLERKEELVSLVFGGLRYKDDDDDNDQNDKDDDLDDVKRVCAGQPCLWWSQV